MKKIIYLLVVIMIIGTNLIQAQDLNSVMELKMLNTDKDLDEVNPEDIPNEAILRKMGLNEQEIQKALDFKYGISYNTGTTFEKSIFNDTLNSNEQLELSSYTDTVTYPPARIYGQDIFRNNELSFYQKSLDAKAPENYKVGSGDEISISVWGYSQFSETLLVDDRGYITPSSYGRIYVKGLTFKKMRSLLKSKFSTFLDMKNSEIDVTLSYSRVITINIVGEVYNPGSYSIPAINTAFNALIAAHGPNQLGTVRNIYIKRDGKTVDSLDVYQFLFNPTRSQDIYLRDGDYLFVPPAQHIINVTGEVNRPYTYEAKSGESVANLIKYAGGYTTNAFADVVTLKRIEYSSIRVNDVHKDDVKLTAVKHGDEIIVNAISNTLSNVVSVKGSIGVAGDYEFTRGEHLLDLLNRAKCIDDKTFLEKVYIVRLNEDRTRTHLAVNLAAILDDKNHEDNILLQEYDIVRVLSVEDFDEKFQVSVLGAVRAAGSFDFGDGMALQDLLLQAGGLTRIAEQSRIEIFRVFDYDISSDKLVPKRAKVKTVKIKDGLILSKEASEFLLQPLDQIFVRDNPNFIPNERVFIAGEVKFPGVYSLLSKAEKISSLISRAGGLTDEAFLSGVHMNRKIEAINDSLAIQENVIYLNLEKALKKPMSRFNIELQNQDFIEIPQKNNLVRITGKLDFLNKESISAPTYKRKRAHYYVNNFAGGYSINNDKRNTTVIYANGITKKTIDFGLFTISPRPQFGSTIMVYNKELKNNQDQIPFDLNKVLDKTMTKASAVLTLIFLIQRFQQ
tara:strand:- start:178 stop:2544 length:2367 start_codon:yes stop_codon:yes gene_type:complete